MNISNFFGISEEAINGITASQFSWLKDLLNGINMFLYPLLITVIAAGAIYAVFLGINLIRAETTEKREEAKKRLTWAIIGVISIFVLILVLELVGNNITNIIPGAQQ